MLKINAPESVKLSGYKGNIFENYLINEYIKLNYHKNLLRDFWFWRDAVGNEVDLIWQQSEKLNLIEIKASETIQSKMFKGLNYFEKLKPELVDSKTLVHTGLFGQKRSQVTIKSWKDAGL